MNETTLSAFDYINNTKSVLLFAVKGKVNQDTETCYKTIITGMNDELKSANVKIKFNYFILPSECGKIDNFYVTCNNEILPDEAIRNIFLEYIARTHGSFINKNDSINNEKK